MRATNWDTHWSTLRRGPLLERLRIHAVWSGYRRLLREASGPLPPAPRILELGAGSGHASLCLARRHGGHATLVERNERAIAFSRRLWGEAGLLSQVTHQQGDLLAFSDPEGFDLVHSGGVIEHFHGEDRRRIVEIHARSVRPGGRLLIMVPVDGLRYRLFKRLLLVLGKWIYTDEVPWVDGEVAAAFAPHGFRVTATTAIKHEVGYLLERRA